MAQRKNLKFQVRLTEQSREMLARLAMLYETNITSFLERHTKELEKLWVARMTPDEREAYFDGGIRRSELQIIGQRALEDDGLRVREMLSSGQPSGGGKVVQFGQAKDAEVGTMLNEVFGKAGGR